MLGTIVNSGAIILGCILGLVLKGKMNKSIEKTIMNGLALCVLYIGISGSLKGEDTLIIILSITIGGLIGELVDIDKRLSSLGQWIESKFKNKNNTDISISEGFVSASLLFCVGAMAIVGSLESGLRGNYDTLFAKSLIDGITAIIFTSSLGIGVIFSAASVFIYQGSITLAATYLSVILSTSIINNMTGAGSLLIIGLALNMLNITKIKIANLLPAVFIPILLGLFM